MEEKTTGIVLSSIDYSENDKILNIFTMDSGLITAKIKGVKKAGAKLKFASEPFCFAEFLFSSTGDRRVVTGASLLESFYPIRENIFKYYAGTTILEFTKKFAKEGIVAPDFLFLAVNSLKELTYSDKTPHEVLIKYLLEALKQVGYGIDTNGCAICGTTEFKKFYFDAERGCFLCADCFNGVGREINYYTFKALYNIKNGQTIEKEYMLKALKLLSHYIFYKAEIELKSLKNLLELEYFF